RSIRITKNAFQASLEIPDPSAELGFTGRMGSKAWLQMQILEELIESSPSDAEALLPQAEQWARDVLSVRLISGFVKDKKLDHAEDLIRRMSEHDFFPYEAAADLMLAQKSSDRSRTFQMAVENYRTLGYDARVTDQEDLGTLVIRFWQDLQPADVLSAIDA